MIQFNSSWWEIPCSSPWRGCPCKNDQLPPILRLRGLCPFSTMRTKNPTIGTRFTPVQRPDNLRNDWFKGGLSSKIELEGENPDNPSTERMKWTFSDVVWNVTAFTNAPKDSFALGKWEWTVTGDSGNCHKGKISLFLFLQLFLFVSQVSHTQRFSSSLAVLMVNSPVMMGNVSRWSKGNLFL